MNLHLIQDALGEREKGRPREIVAPFEDQLEVAVRHHCPVMLTGPRGTGKTSAVRRAAQRAGKRLEVVQGHADLAIEELRGSMTLANGSSRFVHGPVARAALENAWLLFDEVNLCRPAISAWMNNVIDKPGTIALPDTGETIDVPASFQVFFCFNDGYAGTRELNEALKDRCRVIHCPYWPREHERALLRSKVADTVADVDIERVLTAAEAIRAARRDGAVDFDLSIRTLEQWVVDAYERTADLVASFRDVVLPKVGDPHLFEDQHQALLELVRVAVDTVADAEAQTHG